MDRLQKKCFIVSAGMHLLLPVIFLFSSGFLASKPKATDITPLTFVPSILLANDIRGGGNPNAKPPPPSAPPQVATPPSPAPVAHEAPAPERIKPKEPEVREPKPAEQDDEPSLERKSRKVEISTKLVTRPRSSNKTSSHSNDSSAEENKAMALRRDLANRIGRAVADLGQGSSPVTSIEDFGPGGGGPAYAGYAAFVQAKYLSAWVAPDETTTDAAIAKATVTIARDGTVISHTLTKRSGDSQIDSSILRTLERVTSIGRPFPEEMKDKERTYILRFDLTVKRGQA